MDVGSRHLNYHMSAPTDLEYNNHLKDESYKLEDNDQDIPRVHLAHHESLVAGPMVQWQLACLQLW